MLHRSESAIRGHHALNAEALVGEMILSGARWMTGVHARWLGCKPSARPRVYFANHSSHVDAVVLRAALPGWLRRRTRPVAAADYWLPVPWRRYLAERVFHSVFVDRVSPDPLASKIEPLIDALDHRESLILFPEGTRGPGTDLLPFKAGIFHIARERPAIELVPVWLDNCYQVLPKGEFLPVPMLCTATFGEPTRIIDGEERTACLSRLRGLLLAVNSDESSTCGIAAKNS